MTTVHNPLRTIFQNESPDFMEGLECGVLLTHLKNNTLIDNMQILKSNDKFVKQMCELYGYFYKIEPHKEGEYFSNLTAYPKKIASN